MSTSFVRVAHASIVDDYLNWIHNAPFAENSYDERGFNARNCTSFIAYIFRDKSLHETKFTNVWTRSPDSRFQKWGNANTWDDYARAIGIAVDNRPAVGAVAQWDSGAFGHVAHVTAVHGNLVDVEEYNLHNDGNYGTRTNLSAPTYIHLERNIPGGWWQGNTPKNSWDPPNYRFPTTPTSIPIQAKIQANSSLPHRVATYNLTYFDPGDGTNQWHARATGQFTDWVDASASYTPRPNTKVLYISFDVTVTDTDTGAVSFQRAPMGIRTICRTDASAQDCTKPLAFVDWSPPSPAMGGGDPGGGGGQQDCSPGQYQAAVFTDANYGGSCVLKGMGEYPNPESIGLPNDSITSIKVGSGANVRLCDNAGLNSPCEYFSANDPDLANNMINTNTVSSMKVEGGAPTTGCVPNDSQVAFFMDENYGGTCIIKEVGRYEDPAAINLPNDTISSLKVGNRVKVRVCDNSGVNSPCEIFDYDDSNLNNNMINTNTISSAEVELRGGIALCDGTNYGGPCKWFGVGKYNMQEQGFNDITESVRYDDNWANLYHIVLWTERDQTGNPAHYDNSVPEFDVGTAMRNRVRSIEIYKHTPPNAEVLGPADGVVLPTTTTSVQLTYENGPEKRVHVWSDNVDFFSPWASPDAYTLTDLTPGTYSWQAQGRNQLGEGPWSAIRTFTIKRPPVVAGGSLTMEAGTTQSVQVQAFGDGQASLSLSAAGLPGFATFTDNGGGVGTLSLSPALAQAGQYSATFTASDGETNGTGTVDITVEPPASASYQAEYFANRNLSGSPVLTRAESAIDHDWGGDSPGEGVPADNFSARWTKTSDFTAGTYRFTATGDDGLRLYVDGQLVIDKWIDQPATTYTTDRALSAGSHTVVLEYYEAAGGAIAVLTVEPAANGDGVELLPEPWHLTGNNGASEKYQSIDPQALAGKTHLRVTYNLHGMDAISGDASAIIFDQNGWKFATLAEYGENGMDGEQTVDVPLTDFDLDLSQPVGTLHTRFWYGSPFTVDITSIVAH
ncbi:PA14 domain-containing protein [Acrocarpospora sp. B8E8]|uniref:PA14 domain-containing protein n=1 Tax=Acrocarpospora sp. B8E8 TaxID=3153572 RepID=UPI00325FA157